MAKLFKVFKRYCEISYISFQVLFRDTFPLSLRKTCIHNFRFFLSLLIDDTWVGCYLIPNIVYSYLRAKCMLQYSSLDVLFSVAKVYDDDDVPDAVEEDKDEMKDEGVPM